MKQRRSLFGLKILRLLMGVFIVLAGTSARAGTINVFATGSCWLTNDPFVTSAPCIDTHQVNNTFAGNNESAPGTPSDGVYRNWFAFDLPSLVTISSASLFVWNEDANFNTINFAATFNLYEALDLTLAGLTNGPGLGSVSVNDANAGPSRYIEIGLNDLGIAALTSGLGRRFIFGGNNDNGEQIFGYTNGTPIAYLALDDGNNVPTVPAPATLSLLGLGIAALARTLCA